MEFAEQRLCEANARNIAQRVWSSYDRVKAILDDFRAHATAGTLTMANDEKSTWFVFDPTRVLPLAAAANNSWETYSGFVLDVIRDTFPNLVVTWGGSGTPITLKLRDQLAGVPMQPAAQQPAAQVVQPAARVVQPAAQVAQPAQAQPAQAQQPATVQIHRERKTEAKGLDWNYPAAREMPRMVNAMSGPREFASDGVEIFGAHDGDHWEGAGPRPNGNTKNGT